MRQYHLDGAWLDLDRVSYIGSPHLVNLGKDAYLATFEYIVDGLKSSASRKVSNPTLDTFDPYKLIQLKIVVYEPFVQAWLEADRKPSHDNTR